jgi:hypothetical protein
VKARPFVRQENLGIQNSFVLNNQFERFVGSHLCPSSAMAARIGKGFQPLQMLEQALSQHSIRPTTSASRADLGSHRSQSSGLHQNFLSQWQLHRSQRGFVTSPRLTLEKKPSKSASKVPPSQSSSKPQSSSNPSLPKLSMSGLSIGRGPKIFIIAVICVLGTMESIFWINVLWAKFKGEPEANEEEN